MPRENVVFSEPTTNEEMWQEGGRYGSIDPCFPSKVIQAHVHELLFHSPHRREEARGPLNYMFYPCLTHVPSWVEHDGHASCPIVAGSRTSPRPRSPRRSTSSRARHQYLDPALTFTEPNLPQEARCSTVWGPRSGITEDESDWAVDQGTCRARRVRRPRCRSGAGDPGAGRARHKRRDPDDRPALPQRSGLATTASPRSSRSAATRSSPCARLPRIPAYWLRGSSATDDPFDIRDVWPENYSANSCRRCGRPVRGPPPATSPCSTSRRFKCGHDAPTYGIIDKIMGAAKVPYSALHDIDANKPGGSISREHGNHPG
jgi:hypothetical protein